MSTSVVEEIQITKKVNDTLHLHNSDNPGTVLVSAPLNGKKNYFSWSRFMMIALRALDFVDGTLLEPVDRSAGANKWKKIDSIVTTWSLSSLSKELVDAFIYSSSAKNLWNEIIKRFV